MTNTTVSPPPGEWQSPQLSSRREAVVDHDHDPALSETTPLLAHRHEGLQEDEDDFIDSISRQKNRGLRWPTVIALVVLCLSVIAILILRFAAPSMMKQYAQEATVFKPTGLSITTFTTTWML